MPVVGALGREDAADHCRCLPLQAVVASSHHSLTCDSPGLHTAHVSYPVPTTLQTHCLVQYQCALTSCRLYLRWEVV